MPRSHLAVALATALVVLCPRATTRPKFRVFASPSPPNGATPKTWPRRTMSSRLARQAKRLAPARRGSARPARSVNGRPKAPAGRRCKPFQHGPSARALRSGPVRDPVVRPWDPGDASDVSVLLQRARASPAATVPLVLPGRDRSCRLTVSKALADGAWAPADVNWLAVMLRRRLHPARHPSQLSPDGNPGGKLRHCCFKLKQSSAGWHGVLGHAAISA